MSSKFNPSKPSQLDFHRPKRLRDLTQPSGTENENVGRIPKLTEESKKCIRNLAAYRAPKPKFHHPRSKSAAVLVALFVGRQGDLYVLLSRRSSTLRTYAGDTSLPGGKVEQGDKSMEDTARREAFEEIGLPKDRTKVPLLCILEPFLAAELIVTPVVVLILDNTLRPVLNANEVTSLFSHPLSSFLTTSPPFPTEPDTLEVPYHTSFDFRSSGPSIPLEKEKDRGQKEGGKGKEQHTLFRVHQFLTGREAGGIKPVFGLTASILIHTSTIAHARLPSFELHPPSPPNPPTPPMQVRIAWALLNKPSFTEACTKESVDLGKARKVLEEWEREVLRERRGARRTKSSKGRSKL
ncbi:hypothetical protein CPC08DRAFT_716179 [Agrocybe pediades]|nr:hypothetical protein CPC08DRAFT_716179 [Agrocybe pediades]